MESISINIVKLGMLRNAGTIRLNQLMVFSGESGLGKSYLAILCHYFFDILLDRKRIYSFLKERGLNYENIRAAYRGEPLKYSFQKSELESWLAKDAISYLGYMINSDLSDSEVVVSLPDSITQTFSLTYWEDVSEIAGNNEVYAHLKWPAMAFNASADLFHDDFPLMESFRLYLIVAIFGSPSALTDNFVFPPSRAPYLTEEVNPVTGMGIKFKGCLYKLKLPLRTQEILNGNVQQLFRTILNGEIQYKDGNYVYAVNDTDLPLSASAASVRELAPIEQMVKKVKLSSTAILIEEPEAHLHPLKQRMMADITSSLMRAGAYMQITTHSDYYLRRMNELMLINKLKGKDDFYKIAHYVGIIPELAIDAIKVSAYLLQRRKDGSAEVVEQNLEEGIPFASFHDAMKESLSTLAKLNNLLSEESYNGNKCSTDTL